MWNSLAQAAVPVCASPHRRLLLVRHEGRQMFSVTEQGEQGCWINGSVWLVGIKSLYSGL